MSTLNNLSFQIPEADLQAVKDALATIQSILSSCRVCFQYKRIFPDVHGFSQRLSARENQRYQRAKKIERG